MTTKIWSLFQYPPKLELAAGRRHALVASDHPLAAGAEFILGRRGYRWVGGQYGAPRRVEMKAWRWAALAFCLAMAAQSGVLPYFALLNAAFSPKRDHAGNAGDAHAAQHRIRVHRIVLDPARAQEHGVPRQTATATVGTILALVIAYVTTRRVVPGHRVLGFLATARVAVPGIVLGVGLFLSYTRPPFVLVWDAVDTPDRVFDQQPAVRLSAIAGGVRHHSSGT